MPKLLIRIRALHHWPLIITSAAGALETQFLHLFYILGLAFALLTSAVKLWNAWFTAIWTVHRTFSRPFFAITTREVVCRKRRVPVLFEQFFNRRAFWLFFGGGCGVGVDALDFVLLEFFPLEPLASFAGTPTVDLRSATSRCTISTTNLALGTIDRGTLVTVKSNRWHYFIQLIQGWALSRRSRCCQHRSRGSRASGLSVWIIRCFSALNGFLVPGTTASIGQAITFDERIGNIWILLRCALYVASCSVFKWWQTTKQNNASSDSSILLRMITVLWWFVTCLNIAVTRFLEKNNSPCIRRRDTLEGTHNYIHHPFRCCYRWRWWRTGFQGTHRCQHRKSRR